MDSGGVVAGHPHGLGLGLGLQLALKSMFAYGLCSPGAFVGRWSDQLAQRVVPYVQYVGDPLGASEWPSHYGYTYSTTDPTKDIPRYILSGAHTQEIAQSGERRADRLIAS